MFLIYFFYPLSKKHKMQVKVNLRTQKISGSFRIRRKNNRNYKIPHQQVIRIWMEEIMVIIVQVMEMVKILVDNLMQMEVLRDSKCNSNRISSRFFCNHNIKRNYQEVQAKCCTMNNLNRR